jgi:integrase
LERRPEWRNPSLFKNGRNLVMAEGIDTRHSRACVSRAGAKCNCEPSYQAHVWSKRDGKRIRKTFPTLAAARTWRTDAKKALQDGKMRAPTPETLRVTGDALVAGMQDGSVRKRGGERYKPSAIRSYESVLIKHVYPDLGAVRVSDLQRRDLQAFADRLAGKGLDGSTIRNVLMPLRVIFRRAIEDGLLVVNPGEALRLPAVTGKRDRIAPPDEAKRLLVALSADRALWATAFYAALRAGELQALQWDDVDLARGVIQIRRSWDRREGFVDPKSHAGRRTVPMAANLRDELTSHRASSQGHGFVFGRTPEIPFNYWGVVPRAQRAWKDAGLEAISLHECRHTAVTLWIEAGVEAKRISVWAGHQSVSFTLDRYGHLFKQRDESEMAEVDAYLAAHDEESRLEALRDNRATVSDRS